MNTYQNGSGSIPRLNSHVVDTLINLTGVSTYSPHGDQLRQLHAFAHAVAEELLARLPTPNTAPPLPAPTLWRIRTGHGAQVRDTPPPEHAAPFWEGYALVKPATPNWTAEG